MPIYEYACSGCGNKFEALVRSETKVQCPNCQSSDLEKLLSVFATGTDSTKSMPPMASPCGSCGHPDGPGACGLM